MVHSHYDNLQVAQNASQEVIKGAYKYLSQKWHPDRQPPERRAEAERIMKLVNDAYAVLSDPVARQEHDEWIRAENDREQAKSRAKAQAKASRDQARAQDEAEQARVYAMPPRDTGREANRLSARSREEYVNYIVRGHWPIAVVGAIVSVCLLLGLLSLMDWFKSLLDSHPSISGLVALALIGSSATAIVEDKKKELRAIDDDTLKLTYDKSARRRMALILFAAIIVAGLLIGFAVVVVGIGRSLQERDTPGMASNAPTSGSNVPAPPPPSTQPPVRSLPPGKPVLVKNECDVPLTLYVAYKNAADKEWSVGRWLFAGKERSRLSLQDTPLTIGAAGAYFYARSEDGNLEWGARSDEQNGAEFNLSDGSGRARFRPVGDESDPNTLTITLMCRS
ncbi:MAG: DnaJ domain-containing protein [Proteobacteria bacterium]|nr:DnaJ domain-containing protein [Pseudomonadota bacterium]